MYSLVPRRRDAPDVARRIEKYKSEPPSVLHKKLHKHTNRLKEAWAKYEVSSALVDGIRELLGLPPEDGGGGGGDGDGGLGGVGGSSIGGGTRGSGLPRRAGGKDRAAKRRVWG